MDFYRIDALVENRWTLYHHIGDFLIRHKSPSDKRPNERDFVTDTDTRATNVGNHLG